MLLSRRLSFERTTWTTSSAMLVDTFSADDNNDDDNDTDDGDDHIDDEIH